jgi:trehalose/maltose transport system substrate-binding protein
MEGRSEQTRRSFLAAAAALPLSALLAGCRGASSSDSAGAEALPEISVPPPPVRGAERHAGARLVFYAESVGIGAAIDRALARRFALDTAAVVDVVLRPRDATETYAGYQRLFQARSADVDVLSLDVVWPGIFAPHLLDLAEALGGLAATHLAAAVRNDTVRGRLVAMPYFTDFGMLYYRSDLLEKYGYGSAPSTWDELEGMARRIQEGERARSRSFAGFVWQGKAYEGLTCNALEWIHSHGGGAILEGREPTVENPRAAQALARFRGFVGTISPVGVTGYEEEDARNVFQGGNAAFMRNWPYAYAAGGAKGSLVEGRFDAAPLPHEPGYESSATLGGWTLGVSRYSRFPDAAIHFVGYLCSPEVQRFRALVGGYIPTIPAVQGDPDVVRVLPFLERLRGTTLVARPSNQAGARYNEVSIAFYQGVSKALYGTNPEEALSQIARRIRRSLR